MISNSNTYFYSANIITINHQIGLFSIKRKRLKINGIQESIKLAYKKIYSSEVEAKKKRCLDFIMRFLLLKRWTVVAFINPQTKEIGFVRVNLTSLKRSLNLKKRIKKSAEGAKKIFPITKVKLSTIPSISPYAFQNQINYCRRPSNALPIKVIAGFTLQDVLKMAHFCEFTYKHETEVGDEKRKEYEGMNYEITLIEKSFHGDKDISCTILTKGSEVIIAFRGTKVAENWWTNLDALINFGGTHAGFHNAFKSIRPEVFAHLNKYAEKQGIFLKDLNFTVTGHSLGGALATLCSFYLAKKMECEKIRVITYGSPRVFSKFLKAPIYENLLGESTLRVHQKDDKVGGMPLGLAGYKHVGKRCTIENDDNVLHHYMKGYLEILKNLKEEDFKVEDIPTMFAPVSHITGHVALAISRPVAIVREVWNKYRCSIPATPATCPGTD